MLAGGLAGKCAGWFSLDRTTTDESWEDKEEENNDSSDESTNLIWIGEFFDEFIAATHADMKLTLFGALQLCSESHQQDLSLARSAMIWHATPKKPKCE